MPWEIERDEAFEKALKELRKRFPHAERDIVNETFKSGAPSRTDPLPAFGRKLWKGRIGSSDARRGTSGGFRVIYYWDETFPNWCCLGTFYFKGDCADLPADELRRIFIRLEARFKRAKQERPEKEKLPDVPPDVDLPDKN